MICFNIEINILCKSIYKKKEVMDVSKKTRITERCLGFIKGEIERIIIVNNCLVN